MNRRKRHMGAFPYPYEIPIPDQSVKIVDSGMQTPFMRSSNPEFTPKIPTPQQFRQESLTDFLLQRLVRDADTFLTTLALDRGLIGRSVTVTNTPTRVIQAQFLRGYILVNPTSSIGKASAGSLVASANRAALASGNTQASALDVSDYKEVKLFLSITGGTGGVVNVNAQTQDPVSGNWASAQVDVFSSPSAVGTYYANLGTLGVDENFAISWDVSVAGTSTFSIGYILKDTSVAFGTANAIYLGGPDVTTTAGFSLLEGKDFKFFMKPNAELWAVSNSATGLTLKVFELQ